MPQSVKPGSVARPDTGGPALDELCVNTIRTLSMDAVQRAESGHPGTPMALAPAAYVLFSRVMRYNPGNPDWFDRDRFILSCGHASMLLYSVLHLCGYDLSLDELVNFRQCDEASRNFLEQLVEVAASTGSLMLVNFRPEFHASWMQKSHYQQLPLVPLGPEAIHALLQDLLGSDRSVAALPKVLTERTAGNPFFVEPLSAAARARRGGIRERHLL